MQTELKRLIVNFMLDNQNEFQLTNETIKKFDQYIYTPEGAHCIGGEEVREFIISVNSNVINFRLKL